jgi:hypothetical protein
MRAASQAEDRQPRQAADRRQRQPHRRPYAQVARQGATGRDPVLSRSWQLWPLTRSNHPVLIRFPSSAPVAARRRTAAEPRRSVPRAEGRGPRAEGRGPRAEEDPLSPWPSALTLRSPARSRPSAQAAPRDKRPTLVVGGIARWVSPWYACRGLPCIAFMRSAHQATAPALAAVSRRRPRPRSRPSPHSLLNHGMSSHA